MAIKKGKHVLTLYLASWQKRMMKDFMPRSSFRKTPIARITKMLIREPLRSCLASYKIPPNGIIRGDWVMPLTDEQMNMVREELGSRIPITSINVSPESLKGGGIVFC